MLPGRRRASPRAPSSSSSSSSRSESSEYALSAARASVRAPCRDGPAPALGGFRGESGDAPGSVPVSVPVAVAVPVAGASFRRLPGTPFAGAARACLEGFPAERLFFVAGGGSGRGSESAAAGSPIWFPAERDTSCAMGSALGFFLGRPTGRLPRGRPEASAVAAAAAAGAAGGAIGFLRGLPRFLGSGVGIAGGAAGLLTTAETGVSDLRGRPRFLPGTTCAVDVPTGIATLGLLLLPGGRPRGRLGVCSPALWAASSPGTDIVREGRDPYRGGRSKVIRRFTRAFGRAPTPRASAPRRFPRSAAVPHSVRPELCVRTARPGRSCGGDAPRVVRIRGHDVIRKPRAQKISASASEHRQVHERASGEPAEARAPPLRARSSRA